MPVTLLSEQGFIDLGDMRLEYRMIGPRPEAAPTLVMLHEGLGCVGMWGDFPDKLQAATGCGVFVYSRLGYGQSILVIDKNVEALTRIADRHYLIERGRVVWTGTSRGLAAAPDVQHRYLGI